MVEEKSNEIPAVPEPIDLLGKTLKGTVVSAGALNTQKATAAAIIAKKDDYVLAVRDNQPELSRAVSLFPDNPADTAAPMWSSTAKGHGRIEVRSCWQSEDVKWIPAFREWRGRKSICMVPADVDEAHDRRNDDGPPVFHKQPASGASGDSALCP